jgi:excisionase family DNA binding protein
MTYTRAEPEFLTTDEAAALISVTPRTIQRYKAEGRLAFMTMGSRVRFRRQHVLALLQPGAIASPQKSWTRDAQELPAAFLRQPSRRAEAA